MKERSNVQLIFAHPQMTEATLLALKSELLTCSLLVTDWLTIAGERRDMVDSYFSLGYLI